MVKVPKINAIVDGFKYNSQLICPNYIFFLTHMHSDHYNGLTPTWNRGPVYCSPETAKLVKDLYPQLKDIVSLELDVKHWIITNKNTNEGVNVTFIDANHCIGSVMILFQGEKCGNILYTGDFRFIPSMLDHEALLNSSGELISIDHLFLDNTFSDPEFVFPPQDVCRQMVFDAIEENPESDVWIKNECFGKEKLYIELSIKFNTLIVISPKMYRKICLLSLSPEKFTTNENEGHIRIVDTEQMRGLYERNKNQISTIGIWLTGWVNHFHKHSENGVTTYKIPYSGHSNSEELTTFTRAIKAKNVTFTSSCARRSKGNSRIVEETYSRKSDVYIPPETPEIIQKRKVQNPYSSHLKKTKRPKVLGSKIK